MADVYNGMKFGNAANGTAATNGEQLEQYALNRSVIKYAVDEQVYGGFADFETMAKNKSKVFRVKRKRLLLDDANVNDQGLDVNGKIIGNTNYIFNNVAYDNQTDADNARTAWIAANPNATIIPDVVQITTGGGNLYGSSRDVETVLSQMPSLAEGTLRGNRVGVKQEIVTTTLSRYGMFIEFDDELEMFGDLGESAEMKRDLGVATGQIIDDLVQLAMLGGAGVKVYGGTATQLSEVGESQDGGATNEDGRITEKLIRKLVRTLRKNKAQKNTSIITGSAKVGTLPVNASYYAICSPDVVYDLKNISAYQRVSEYGNANNIHKYEVGALDEVRFIETNRAMAFEGGGADAATNTLGQKVTNGKIDVHPIIVPTKGSFAQLGLQGEGKIQIKSKLPGQIDRNDVYGVVGIHSVNFWFGSLVRHPEQLAVIYVSVSE